MAQLVFQPHPKELHIIELLEPDHRPGCPVLRLHPLNIFQGGRTVDFQRKEPTQLMVFF